MSAYLKLHNLYLVRLHATSTIYHRHVGLPDNWTC